MKRIRLVSVVALSLIALALVYSQAQLPKSVEVTAQTVARQPRGKPYVMDLTRNGKTYTVAAEVASRVRIRTSEGEMTMTEFMSKLGVTTGRFLPGSKFLIGTASDLRAVNFGLPPATRTSATATAKNFTCDPILPVCECDGFGDCLLLSLQCDVILCVPSKTTRKTICLCTKKQPRLPG